ncbi:hypothetical protein IW261DRAFT_1604486 [Armillaria novae-zelandiae]|uniref:BTB domain-containing protein n=1 Tax=Armillaria novae-zelandiae TaxID=153914 RepID=A0AA39PM20_9AGAR|nr:hypothetical protein IW261DRAFT_1604486 [Armillaria novae-zelandiae]
MNVTAPSGARIRNSKFYWEPMTFLVENQLFKVARHLFVDSSKSAVFSSMFSIPQGNADMVDGSDDEHPVVLQDVQSADFEHLLAALVAWDQKMPAPPALGRDGWFSVLKLASMWRMQAIRRLAIDELTKLNMSDVDRVVYGKEYAVVDWVMSGYRDLTNRKTVITADDISRLTVPTCLNVWQVQLSISETNDGGSVRTYFQLLESMFSSELSDVFRRSQAFGDEIQWEKKHIYWELSPFVPN